ncbi:hypothetical protein CLDAP_27200 [Caldilinea aerophila DSM 14535 = NBRC 104270]|uniref:Uncharacterized protein n=1 Tax=Caldilinea aerophila (strain DSM 14535 / JCM 11387 / NBRC 104270 / STL-6-O1) TaxID=926550 RepID=I0I672_CALAS|nr:hypothetical protein CLDAP_27200 [Caldilinea aerophila DSM 14535 = NBRC 104270]
MAGLVRPGHVVHLGLRSGKIGHWIHSTSGNGRFGGTDRFGCKRFLHSPCTLLVYPKSDRCHRMRRGKSHKLLLLCKHESLDTNTSGDP